MKNLPCRTGQLSCLSEKLSVYWLKRYSEKRCFQCCLISPQVCLLYNKGEALYGYCNLKDKCSKLHVCKSFVRGECRLPRCKRSHQLIHETSLKLLQDQGLNIPSVVNFQIISAYRHMKLHKMLENKGETIRDNRALSTRQFWPESESREETLLSALSALSLGNQDGQHFMIQNCDSNQRREGWSLFSMLPADSTCPGVWTAQGELLGKLGIRK